MDINSTITLRSGNKMPILGLGTWQLTVDTADIIAFALSLGYPMIDTSSDYKTQPGIGEGIKRSNINREDFYLVTKVEEYDDAYARTKSNLEELGLDYVDLMLIHRPPPEGAGTSLWEGLVRAKKDGLTKDIGVSNYTIELIDELVFATNEVPVVNQIEWSPFGYSNEMMDYCLNRGIAIQSYSPLTRQKKLEDNTLQKLSEKHKKTPAQILIRWNLQNGTIPLPKANKKEHLEENLDVFNFELENDDMSLLSSLNKHYSTFGNLPYV